MSFFNFEISIFKKRRSAEYFENNAEKKQESKETTECVPCDVTLSHSFAEKYRNTCAFDITLSDSYYTVARTYTLFLKSIPRTKGQPTLHMSAAPFLVTVTRNLTRDYDCGT